jgi:hypothetical protein
MVYKADVADVLNRVDAWWNCAVLDRPVVQVGAHKGTQRAVPAKSFATLDDRWLDAEYVVDCADARLAAMYFAGELLPAFMPNLGPEIAAASVGAPLCFGEDTSWSVPLIEDLQNIPHLRVDPDNRYVKALLNITRVALEVGRGKFLVGIMDIHPGADLAAALRDPQQLCLDLADAPDRVHALMDEIRSVFYDLYELQDDMITRAGQRIRTTWLPLYSTGRYYVPSCDFAALISPRAFSDFFLQEIVEEVEWLDHSIFHLDGPDAVRHLDALLAIKKLQAIQFVPGAGAGPASHWIPVYKRIQAGGKAMHVSVAPQDIDAFMQALRPEGVMLSTWVSSVEEADAIVKKIASWK